MKYLRQVFSGIAALAVIATLGFFVPSFAGANDVPEDAAASVGNRKLALRLLDDLNTAIRGVPGTELTEQQVADSQAHRGVTVDKVQQGTGTGSVLPAYKVNDQVVRWAQARADEIAAALAARQDPNQADTYNGAPDWARQSLFKSPHYVRGTYAFGPEAAVWWHAPQQIRINPLAFWDRNFTARQVVSSDFTVLSQLANVAGVGVARVPYGPQAGRYVAVLEIAYTDGSEAHGNTMTVAEARAALDAESNVESSVDFNRNDPSYSREIVIALDTRRGVPPEIWLNDEEPAPQPDNSENTGGDVPQPDGQPDVSPDNGGNANSDVSQPNNGGSADGDRPQAGDTGGDVPQSGGSPEAKPDERPNVNPETGGGSLVPPANTEPATPTKALSQQNSVGKDGQGSPQAAVKTQKRQALAQTGSVVESAVLAGGFLAAVGAAGIAVARRRSE